MNELNMVVYKWMFISFWTNNGQTNKNILQNCPPRINYFALSVVVGGKVIDKI